MKKFLSLVLALVMTMSLVTISAGAKDFTDADKVNYTEAVDVMSAVKVIDGYTDGSFNPQGTLTRGAAAKIICNLILGPTTAAALKADTAPFKDVPTDHTFAGYIAYCAKEGIISGYADGTFRPAATLTNYAFLKMLLGALGYDAVTEGYVGDNWSINVAKQALAIGLTDGLKDELVGTAPATREQACLYALNTMQATMIEYVQKTTVNVGGAEVVLAGAVRDVEWGTAKLNDGNIKADGFVQFAEKYFPSLELEVGHGIYGRPANTWKLKKAEIGTYTTKTPSFVYTEATDGQDVYKEMGKVLCDENEYDWEAYVDGKEIAAKDVKLPVKNDDDTYAYTGDGAVTEIYVEESYDAKKPGTVTVVEFNYYIGQVTKVKDTDDGETITVKALSKDAKLDDKTFVVDGYEEDDYVVFTRDFNADEDYVIGEVIEPETMTGDVKRVETDKTSDNTYLKLDDGEKYEYSESLTHNVYDLDNPLNPKHPELNEEYTLYMDPNGFVLGFLKSDEETEYLYVLDSDEQMRDWVAKVVLADATQPKVELKDEYKKGSSDVDIAWVKNNEAAKIATNIDEQIWKYTVSDSGVYTLTYVDAQYPTDKFEINNGEAYVNDVKQNTTFIVDKQTVFVDVDGEKAYVGYDEVPNISDATIAYVEDDGVAVIVFVLDGEIYDKNTTYFFLTSEKRESFKYDGDDYWMLKDAYVNGEKTTLNVAYDAYASLTRAASDWNLTTGVLYQAKKSIEDDGETYITKVVLAEPVTSGDPVAVGDKAFQVKSETTVNTEKFVTNDETVFVLAEYQPKDLKAYDAAKADGVAYTGKWEWKISDGRISDMKAKADDPYTITVDVVKADKQTAELVYVYQKYPAVEGTKYTVTFEGAEIAPETVAKGGKVEVAFAPEGCDVTVSDNAKYVDGKIIVENVTANTTVTVTVTEKKVPVTLTIKNGSALANGINSRNVTVWVNGKNVVPTKVSDIHGDYYDLNVNKGDKVQFKGTVVATGTWLVDGEIYEVGPDHIWTLTATKDMTLENSSFVAVLAVKLGNGITAVPNTEGTDKIEKEVGDTLYVKSGTHLKVTVDADVAAKFIASTDGKKFGSDAASSPVTIDNNTNLYAASKVTFNGTYVDVKLGSDAITSGQYVAVGENLTLASKVSGESVYAGAAFSYGEAITTYPVDKADVNFESGKVVTLGKGVTAKVGTTTYGEGKKLAVYGVGTAIDTLAVDTAVGTCIIAKPATGVSSESVVTSSTPISASQTLVAATKVNVTGVDIYFKSATGVEVLAEDSDGDEYVIAGTEITLKGANQMKAVVVKDGSDHVIPVTVRDDDAGLVTLTVGTTDLFVTQP